MAVAMLQLPDKLKDSCFSVPEDGGVGGTLSCHGFLREVACLGEVSKIEYCLSFSWRQLALWSGEAQSIHVFSPNTWTSSKPWKLLASLLSPQM